MEMTREKTNGGKKPLKVLTKQPDNYNPTTNTTTANIANNKELIAGKLALKQIVNALLNGGMNKDSIYRTLLHYNYIYKQVLTGMTKEDVFFTIASLLSEKKENNLSLTDEIYDYIQGTKGIFTLKDVCEMTQVGNDRVAKNKASVILGRLVKDGTIKREGKKNGVFRKIDTDIIEMDFINAEDTIEPVYLPFGLHKKVEIHPGNIIVCAGEPNSGKTALMLNIVSMNMDQYKVHYFNSEMGGSELKKRLQKHDDHVLSDWKFRAVERAGDFEDVIVPGKGNLNIIDFLEIYDNFYEVSAKLAAIHNKLDGALCVVCIQKNTGTDFGLGGERGLEKPRLYLSLSPNKAKITKAKNFIDGEENPNGQEIKYKLVNGINLRANGDWYRAAPKPKGGKNGNKRI